jgi:hypothetical protein
MEVILNELQKNGVDIDMRTLSHHVNFLLECHEALYNQMILNVNPDEMHVVFNTINVTNFGCAMAYLILAYLIHASEDTTRSAVRLVTAPLKCFDLRAFWIEESFFRRVISRIWL